MISLTALALVACIALPTPKSRIDPHLDTAGTGGCAACHVAAEADGSVSGELLGDIEDLCTRCHGDGRLGRSHPRDIEVERSEHAVAPEELPLDDGRITCVTCHDPHGRWVMLTRLYERQEPAFRESVGSRELAYYQSYYLRISECGEGFTSLCFSCHRSY